MMELEIADILFFIKSIKGPTEHFNILDFKVFTCKTWSSSDLKLKHSLSNYRTILGPIH